MNEIGDMLKQARTEKNITIQDVHNITKIMPKYLTAIEEGRWEVLPGPAYTRGYIRSYAEVVEVDGDYLIELFDEFLEDNTDEIHEPKEQLQKEHNKTSKRVLKKMSQSESTKGWATVLVGVVLLLMFIKFSSVWLDHNKRNTDSIQPPIAEQPSESELESEPESEPEPEPESEPEPEPEVESEPAPPMVELSLLNQDTNSAVYEIVTDKPEFSTTITIDNGPCWVRIVTDDNETWENTMQAGDTYTVQAIDKITIRMGLPQNANIEVEDQAIPHIDSKNPYNCTIQR